MFRNAWCILIFVYLLRDSAVSTYRLGGEGNGEAGWSSSGSGNGDIHLSSDSSLHLSLGSLLGGIIHTFEGKGSGTGSGSGESAGIGSGGNDLGASFNFNGGLGGSSLSTHSSISLGSILKSIFTLPFTITKKIFSYTIKTIWNVATFNISIIRIPVSLSSKIVSAIYGSIKIVIRNILNIICNIGSFNIDIIVGIIDRIKSIVAWVIRQMSSVEIYGVKIGFDVASFFKNGLEDTVGGSLKFLAWILMNISRAFKGTFDVLHIKAILKLPGIRNVLGLIRWAWNYGVEIVGTNVQSAAKFVDSIIYQHQDFFVPIFHYILNFAFAISNAVHQIQYGGWSAGIKATLGNLSITLGPVLSGYWKIHGLGGQSFGNNGTLSFGGGYYDVGSDNNSWDGNSALGQHIAAVATSHSGSGKSPGQGLISPTETHDIESGNLSGGFEETSSSPHSTGEYNSRYGEDSPNGGISSEYAQVSSGGLSSGSSLDEDSVATEKSSEEYTPGSEETPTGGISSGNGGNSSGFSGAFGEGSNSWSEGVSGGEFDSSSNGADSSGVGIDFHVGIDPAQGVTGEGLKSEDTTDEGIGSVSDGAVGSGSTESTGEELNTGTGYHGELDLADGDTGGSSSWSESTTGTEMGSVLDDGGESSSEETSGGETSIIGLSSESGAVTDSGVTESGLALGGDINSRSNGGDSSGSTEGSDSEQNRGSAGTSSDSEEKSDTDTDSNTEDSTSGSEYSSEGPSSESTGAVGGGSETGSREGETTGNTSGSGDSTVTPGSGSEGSDGGNSDIDISSGGDSSGSIDSTGGSSGGGSYTPGELGGSSDSSLSNEGGGGLSGSIQVSGSGLSGGSAGGGEDLGANFDKITGLGDLGEPSGLVTGPPGN